MKCHNQNCNNHARSGFNFEIINDDIRIVIPLCVICTGIVKDENFSYATDLVSLKN